MDKKIDFDFINAAIASVDDSDCAKLVHYSAVSAALKGRVITPEWRANIKAARAHQHFTQADKDKQRSSYEATMSPRRAEILAKIGTDYVYGSPNGRSQGRLSPTLTVQKHGLSPSKWLMEHLCRVRDGVTSA
jgi:uncharacterized membrane protein